MNKSILSTVFALLTAGCINITTQLHPTVPGVKAELEGRDCTGIMLGIGIGTNTIEQAMMQGIPVVLRPHAMFGPPPVKVPPRPIRTVRDSYMTDRQFLMFGERCLEITGEP